MTKATLVIISRGDTVLLGEKKRGFAAGTYNAPGGKLEEGETLVACAVRETKDEVGVDIDPDGLEEIAEILFLRNGEPFHYVHVYRAHVWHGDPIETGEMRPVWFSHDRLPFDRMLAADAAWFPLALASSKFYARAEYSDSDGVMQLDRIEFSADNPFT